MPLTIDNYPNPRTKPPTIPAIINKNVNPINVYMTTLGILDMAMTKTNDKTKAKILMKIIHGNACNKSGNSSEAMPLAIDT